MRFPRKKGLRSLRSLRPLIITYLEMVSFEVVSVIISMTKLYSWNSKNPFHGKFAKGEKIF